MQARIVDAGRYGIDDPITQADAVRLIVQRVKSAGESDRLVRDRVRKRIQSAEKTRKLVAQSDLGFVFGRLIGWAKGIWPGKFDGFPCIRVTELGVLDGRAPEECFSEIRVELRPADLPRCRELLDRYVRMYEEMYLAVESQRVKARQLEEEVEALRDDAERWRSFVKNSGKRGNWEND